ncbi:MAG TPA: hypothetical protein VHP38_02445 [Ruminiclostridium sp.]|nr:hypothetical protein [Ruminiclostridium sp.]
MNTIAWHVNQKVAIQPVIHGYAACPAIPIAILTCAACLATRIAILTCAVYPATRLIPGILPDTTTPATRPVN